MTTVVDIKNTVQKQAQLRHENLWNGITIQAYRTG